MIIKFSIFLCIVLPIWIILRASKIKHNRTAHIKELLKHEILVNMLFIYLLYLAQMTIFPLNFGIPLERRVSLIPFKTIMQFAPILLKHGLISNSLRPHLNIGAINIVGNVVVFIPVGILIPLVNRRVSTFRMTLLLGFTTSFTIELLQFLFTKGRIMDIDDLILNTLGVAAGWVAFKGIKCLVKDKSKEGF